MSRTHIVKFNSGYDCVNFECVYNSERCYPGSGGSHGKHGLEIEFIVKGKKGAVWFVLYTGWFPQSISEEENSIVDWGRNKVLPVDLGYHSKIPQYKGQEPTNQSCELCDGQMCFYDGSAINAQDAMYTLVNGGDVKLWEFLESYYNNIFNKAKYPALVKYAKPLRNKLNRA